MKNQDKSREQLLIEIDQLKNKMIKLEGSNVGIEMLIENIPVGISISTPEGDIPEVNDALVKIFGYDSKEEFVNTPAVDFYSDPKDRDRFVKLHKKGLVKDLELQFKRKDGSTFWGAVTSKKVTSKEGNIEFINTFWEITDRKLEEYNITESEKKFRLLFENMTSGFVLFEAVLDDKGAPDDLIIRAANKEFEKTTGLKIQEVINKKLKEVLPGIENDEANWIGTYGTIAVTGESKQFQNPSELLGYYYRVTAYQSKPGQCAVVFHDITDQKKVEQELMNTKALLSETEKTGKIGGWAVDLDTMKQTWTEETYRIHELDLDYVPDVSKGINFYAPSSKPIIESAFQNTLETGEPFDLELEFITAKGNKIWVHSVGKAEQVNGVTKAVSGSFQDITDRKLAESQKENAIRELNEHKAKLEEIVKERTTELKEKNKELDETLKVFVGRELKIKTLEKKIRDMGGK